MNPMEFCSNCDGMFPMDDWPAEFAKNHYFILSGFADVAYEYEFTTSTKLKTELSRGYQYGSTKLQLPQDLKKYDLDWGKVSAPQIDKAYKPKYPSTMRFDKAVMTICVLLAAISNKDGTTEQDIEYAKRHIQIDPALFQLQHQSAQEKLRKVVGSDEAWKACIYSIGQTEPNLISDVCNGNPVTYTTARGIVEWLDENKNGHGFTVRRINSRTEDTFEGLKSKARERPRKLDLPTSPYQERKRVAS